MADTQDTEELKPCPHCGSPPFLYRMADDYGGFIVECENCHCRTSCNDDKGVAIWVWNTRPDSPVTVMREALEGIKRIAEKHTGISGARSLQIAMHAIAHAARGALAKLSQGSVDEVP